MPLNQPGFSERAIRRATSFALWVVTRRTRLPHSCHAGTEGNARITGILLHILKHDKSFLDRIAHSQSTATLIATGNVILPRRDPFMLSLHLYAPIGPSEAVLRHVQRASPRHHPQSTRARLLPPAFQPP